MKLEGTILRGKQFEPIDGKLIIENGRITAIEPHETTSSDIICPAFVNAHTHIGDSVAKEAGEGLSLDALVAPPDGLKHQILRETPRDELIEHMRYSARLMQQTGTSLFLDFREGGTEGVTALRGALEDLPINGCILGRGPTSVLEASDGYGASGARDASFEEQRAAARTHGKPFGIHAGERDSEDIDGALSLNPDFLVHMVHPTTEHLGSIRERKIPIVVCPRSNLVTKAGTPPIRELLDRTRVALGTDNVMLNGPSMFREMEFTSKLFDVSARETLGMATWAGAEILGVDCGELTENKQAKLFVLDGESDNIRGYHDPVRTVVRRAERADIKRVEL